MSDQADDCNNPDAWPDHPDADCACDRFGNRCALHDEQNQIIEDIAAEAKAERPEP